MSYHLYLNLIKNNIKNNILLFNLNLNSKNIINTRIINFIGFPPILGFIPKLYVLKYIENIYILLPLIINNIIIIFCYFIIIKSLINKNINSKININFSNLIINIIIIIITTSLLIITPILN